MLRAFIFTLMAVYGAALIIYEEKFSSSSSINDWTRSGRVDYESGTGMRLRKVSSATRALPNLSSYRNARLEVDIAAKSLELQEACVLETSSDNGDTFETMARAQNGQDNGISLKTVVSISDQASNLMVRFKSVARQNNDRCYLRLVRLEGDLNAPSSASPTKKPTESPSPNPTAPAPTEKPTLAPTMRPTAAPTSASPTEKPTQGPTPNPTAPAPTEKPTLAPTKRPTAVPTPQPSNQAPPPVGPVNILSNSGTSLSGWTRSGRVEINYGYVSTFGSSSASLLFSTSGFDQIGLSGEIYAASLEGAERCYFEVFNGATWTNVGSLGNGQENSWAAYTLPTSGNLDDRAQAGVRLRSTGAQSNDKCRTRNIVVWGVSLTTQRSPTQEPTPHPTLGLPPGTNPYLEDLGLGGVVSRSELTANELLTGSGQLSKPGVGAFAVPNGAGNPEFEFEGTLTLIGVETTGSFTELKDEFRYTGSGTDERKFLPPFSFDFVQTGTHIVPVAAGPQLSSALYWEFILLPGRIWRESSDPSGFARVSLPFALEQKNSNCVHNGYLTFLFSAAGQVSRVQYLIDHETCAYFQFDMWGTLSASINLSPVPQKSPVLAEHIFWWYNRLEQRPFSELAAAFPGKGVNSQIFGSDTTSLSHIGLTVPIDGKVVLFTGGCMTRSGTAPMCDQFVSPSYSTAKSMFGAAALMRLEKLYPGTKDLKIGALVSSCSNYNAVSIENAIDMATGNYGSPLYMNDEGNLDMNTFFLAESYTTRRDYSCSYTSKAAPGSNFVYRTTETFVAGAAMDNRLKTLQGNEKDIYADVIIKDLYSGLSVSPVAKTTRRTYGLPRVPLTGYGLVFGRDDVAKIAHFFNEERGRGLLDESLLDSAMFRTTRGVTMPNGAGERLYSKGFWAIDVSIPGCASPVLVPFWSGFGGISVALFPNGLNYFYFSDNYEYAEFTKEAVEVHKILPLC